MIVQARGKVISEQELRRASLLHTSRVEAAVQKYAPKLWAAAAPALLRWLRFILQKLSERYPQFRARDGEDMLRAIISQLSQQYPEPDLRAVLNDMWKSSVNGYFLTTDPRAKDIEAYTRKMIEQDLGSYWKNLTDPGTLARRITDARERGLGYEDVVREVDGQYRTGYFTAERLVRTTYNASANYTAFVQLQQQGYTHKVWLTARDKRVRGAGKSPSKYSHVFMEGQRVPLNEPFITREKFKMMFPGDRSMGAPAGHVIHCRCTVIGIFEGNTPARPTAQQPIQPTPNTQRPRPVRPNPKPAPTPPAPTPTPTTQTAPTQSIRNVLENRERNSPLGQKITHAMNLIDQVHTLKPTSRPIPIQRANLGGSRQGQFRYTTKGRPLDINLSPKAEHLELNAVHEIGHYLDLEGFGGGRKVAASDPQLKEFRDAALASSAIRELRSLKFQPWLEVEGVEYETPVQFITYLLDMDEIWARAYAQFIAEETGDPTLLKQIQQIITDEFPVTQHSQWTKADFAPIREAILKYLERMKWLKQS